MRQIILSILILLGAGCAKEIPQSLYSLYQDFDPSVDAQYGIIQQDGQENVASTLAVNERIYFDHFSLSSFHNDLEKKKSDWYLSKSIAEKKNLDWSDSDEKFSLSVSTALQGAYINDEIYLGDRRLFDYYYEERQWNKNYLPLPLSFVEMGTSYIIRNDRRIFNIDKDSFRVQSSYSSNLKSEGNEFYNTFYHPHINERDYLFSVLDNSIYTEFPGKLVKLNLSEDGVFTKQWSIPLGGLRVMSQPVVTNNSVIILLMNSQREVWSVSVDSLSGKTKWDHYLGISSYVTSGSDKWKIVGDDLILLSNLGFLVSQNIKTGELNWLHIYSERRDDIFQFLRGLGEGGRRDTIMSNQTSILTVSNNRVTYKSRESNSIYQLDLQTGAVVRERKIRDNLVLIGKLDEKILWAHDEGKGSFQILLGGVWGNYETLLHINGAFKFSGYIRKGNRAVIKTDKNIFDILISGKKVNIKNYIGPMPGQLVGLRNRGFVLSDGIKVYMLGEDNIKLPKKDIAFNRLISKKQFDDTSCSQLFSKINQSLGLKHLVTLSRNCGEVIVSNKGVSIRLGRYLERQFGIKYRIPIAKIRKTEISQLPRELNNGFYRYLLENNIKNDQRLYMVSGDQIFSTDMNGNIYWVKNIFKRRGSTATNNIFIESNKNIIIIKDETNIIALRKTDGYYLWSYSLHIPDEFDINSKTKLPYKAFKIYDDQVIISSPPRLLALDISSGMVRSETNINEIENSSSFFSAKNIITIDSKKQMAFEIYPKGLNIIAKYKIDDDCGFQEYSSRGHIDHKSNEWLLTGEFCSLLKYQGKVRAIANRSGKDQLTVLGKNGDIITWNMNSSISFYSPSDELTKINEIPHKSYKQFYLNYNIEDDEVISDHPYIKLSNDQYLFLTLDEMGIVLNKFDLNQKEIISSERIIDSNNERFFRISNVIEQNGKAYFIVSTITTDKMSPGVQADVGARFISYDKNRSKIISQKRLAYYSTYRYPRPVLQLIDDQLFYSIANFKLYWNKL